MNNERGKWKVKTTLEKREGDINKYSTPEERLKFLRENEPYEKIVFRGNCLLNGGADAILSLLTGYGSITVYSNANAEIGVGDSDTAASRTQDDLQAAENYDWQAMEDGFPTAPAENTELDGRSVKFKSSWGSEEGNFVWNEWAIRNGPYVHLCLNRKVESLGTKSGGTWTLEVEISIN